VALRRPSRCEERVVETTVFERAGEIKEVGAGILLAANGVSALGELGLSDEVRRLDTPALAGQIRAWHGATLSDVPTDMLERRLGAPSAAVHRADLQEFLLRELGGENVSLGAECSGFEQDEGGVTAVFAEGSEERGTS
jgi:FAD-dependent urate hydroxylase